MTGIFIRRGEDTQRRTQCEDKGRHCRDASTSPGTLTIAGNHQKLKERHWTDSPSESPEGTNYTSTSGFQHCQRIIFVILNHPVCSGSPRKPMHLLSLISFIVKWGWWCLTSESFGENEMNHNRHEKIPVNCQVLYKYLQISISIF